MARARPGDKCWASSAPWGCRSGRCTPDLSPCVVPLLSTSPIHDLACHKLGSGWINSNVMDRTRCKAQMCSRTFSKFGTFFAVTWISAETFVIAASPPPISSAMVWRKDSEIMDKNDWTSSLRPSHSLLESQYKYFILEIKTQCFMDKRRRNVHSTMVSNSQALPFHKPTAFPQWVFPGSPRVTLSIWNQSVNSWQLPETPHSISCSLPLPSFPLVCFTLQNCRPQQLNVRGSDTVRLQNTTQEHLWPSKIFTS